MADQAEHEGEIMSQRQGMHHDVGRTPGLFKYTVSCVGWLNTIYATVRAYNPNQARDKARAQHPGRQEYGILKTEEVS
jgi:hypothetical protein